MLLVEETVAMAAAQVHKWQANISMEYLMVTSLRVEEGTIYLLMYYFVFSVIVVNLVDGS
jgi:hypothetical protein